MIRGKTLTSTPESPICHLSREEFWKLNGNNGIPSVGITFHIILFESWCVIFFMQISFLYIIMLLENKWRKMLFIYVLIKPWIFDIQNFFLFWHISCIYFKSTIGYNLYSFKKLTFDFSDILLRKHICTHIKCV